jgi:GGDEF domain-containing protein
VVAGRALGDVMTNEGREADRAVPGEPHVLTASIGVVMSSGANAAGDIVRDADAAMYRAKIAGATATRSSTTPCGRA